jgi:putative membrane protein
MGMLFFLIVVVAGGFLAYGYYRRRGGKRLFPQEDDEAMDLARRRYANGEISREEFEQIKRDIEEGSDLK